MVKVEFHFNVNDRLHYTCRLVRKAVASGAWLSVTGADSMLQQIDRDLWLLGETEFISHCWDSDMPRLKERSAVLLCRLLPSPDQRQVLVNLLDAVPTGFEAFARVLEVVDGDPQQKILARQRWKHYASAGLSPVPYDLQSRMST